MVKIGKEVVVEYAREFVPDDIDLGDAGAIEALFDALERENPASGREVEAWLGKWSELNAAVREEEAVRYIRMTCQTDDPEREKAFLEFVENVAPRLKPRHHRLAEKLLACPAVSDLPAERYKVLLRDLENEVRIFREENVPLQTEEEKLSQQYQKLAGAMTVMHEGKERTLQQMARYLEVQDRAVRREAWEKVTGRRLQDRAEMDRLFVEMMALRQRMAKNAGFQNYRDYALRLRGRFDYGVAECESFHDAVEKAVVPLYREFQEKRRKRMGLDRLRPWDLKPDPLGRPPLKPFENVDQLVAGCGRIFDALDPELGRRFRYLAEHELLDLGSRKGKAPGAYSHQLEEARYPFIFANAVGVDHDVETLLHECGHAFHTLECRGEPLSFYRHAPLEFAEVASMSMEFLGSDHLKMFYNKEDVARSIESHLESVIWLFCWIATVDSFQHWIYTHPGHADDERAEAWVRLRGRFGGIEDWSGYEEARRFEWHRQLHIFEVPFYYIEYGIAELGALQVWMRARKDPAAALRDYRKALALGGTRTLPELFSAAGVKFDMGRKTIEPLTREVKAALDQMG
ncbi:MAG TPA: M3 family oligoendopeptidase [bacterium]|nr:M3 family oligoendopeptidase [bacterium]